MIKFNRPFVKHTTELSSGDILHDFRPSALEWGWNGLEWDVAEDGKTAKMMGVGRGLKEGHFIALDHGKGPVGYKIESIEYERNPSDLFTAVVSGSYDFEEGELP